MMTLLQRVDRYFEKKKDYGAIFLRLIIGWRLIYGTQDNVFSGARMIEFRDFLQHYEVPMPMIAAYLSVYAQFICGILFVFGFYTRIAAIIMIINFIAALIIAHRDTSFLDTFDALMMLFGSMFFLFYGAGKLSIDQLRLRD